MRGWHLRQFRNRTATARSVLFATTALTAFAVVSLPLTSPARADDFTVLGTWFTPIISTFPGGYSGVRALSADGTVVVGDSTSPVGFQENHAMRWSGGVATDLGTLGGLLSQAFGVSADGSVVVGSAGYDISLQDHAFRWSGGVMSDLGTLGGSTSAAYGVSADGLVVVGASSITGNLETHAFRWSGGVMSDLGTLGGTNSRAYGVSADGSVVVGHSYMAGPFSIHAFRWSGGVMSDLGTLGGTSSSARAVSADGSVVVGSADIAGDLYSHAFRWSGGVMSDLGTLGGTSSSARAISADGRVVVGTSAVNNRVAAFRWTAGTGIQSVQSLLAAAGVNVSGWQLQTADAVSADGTVIGGNGINPLNLPQGWLAVCSPVCRGLITFGNVAQSFAGQSAFGSTGNAALGNSLGGLTETATQAGVNQGSRTTPYSVYASGGYDSDPAASGTLGLTVDLPDKMVAGVALSVNSVWTDTIYDGQSKMTGGSAGLFLARVPNAGPQWLIGATGLTLKGDIKRGYLNGNDVTSSTGNTTANGYGVTARVGYAFANVLPKTQLTPFVSYTFSSFHLNGYTETDGPFPARFDGYTANAQTSRLGADARFTFAPGKWLWGTLAWAHRLDGAKGTDISGTVIGLFNMTATGASTAQDWTEVTGGARLGAWKNGAVTASLTASVPANYPTTYQVRLGVTQAF